jgi:hypothetical protein
MGVYVFNKEALWQALESDAIDFGKDVVSQLVSPVVFMPITAASQPGRAYWRDVGTIDNYFQTQMEVLQNSSLMSLDPTHYWPIYSQLRSPDTLPETTGIAASVVYAKAFVSPLAMVRKSIVLEGARIGSGARVQNAIVLEGANVPPNTNIGFNRQVDSSRFQITNRGIIIVDRESASRLGAENQRRPTPRQDEPKHLPVCAANLQHATSVRPCSRCALLRFWRSLSLRIAVQSENWAQKCPSDCTSLSLVGSSAPSFQIVRCHLSLTWSQPVT